MRALIFSLLIGSAPALAEQAAAPAEPAGASPQKPCSSEQHRQFDFWIGDWTVTQNGQPAGANTIELRHDGCVLSEAWTSVSGWSGSSLNVYDQASGRWHQTWVDASGVLLLLDGGFTDGHMVLSGTRAGPDGREVMNRIRWTPNADGSVRQHWQTSADGKSWTTVFDGQYVRVR